MTRFGSMILLFGLLLGGCGEGRGTGSLSFTIHLPQQAGFPVPLTLSEEGQDVHDLSTGGMIGRIRVEAPDMTTVDRLFPTAEDVGPDDDTLLISDLEVPAGDAREVSGVFFWYEDGSVVTFESEEPVMVSVGSGEDVAVTLPLLEVDTADMTVTLDSNLDWAVRAFPVDGTLDVLFPPVDIVSGDAIFTCPDLPSGHAFWFRLEDASGATVDTVDLPWCTAGAGVCALGGG